MTCKTSLGGAALIAATLAAAAWAPRAHSQRASPVPVCVDLQSTWPANILIEESDATRTWTQLLALTTAPARRCVFTTHNATQVRFTIGGYVDGGLRVLCRTAGQVDRNTTLRVTGPIGHVVCVLMP